MAHRSKEWQHGLAVALQPSQSLWAKWTKRLTSSIIHAAVFLQAGNYC
jgi:hypothetical protein